ncbi:MAG: Ig-like domain-containing protein [Pirellulales bacterium]
MSSVSDADGASNAVDENATIGTTVGITAAAFDSDATNSLVTYILTNDDGGRFAIDANTGIVTVAGAIDRETDGASRSISVRALSADGSYSDQSFTIQINDLDEFDATLQPDGNGAIDAVAENSSTGALVGLTVQAVDQDATLHGITYALLDNAGGRFAIDAQSGVVTVLNGSLLNYEANTSHSIQVEARSQDGSTTVQSFTIQVHNVQENPIAASEEFSMNFIESIQLGAGGLLANDSDPDGDALSAVLVTGPSHGSLVLQSDGSMIYNPEVGYTGDVTFSYLVTDGNLNSNTVQVVIHIAMPPVPQTPGGSSSGSGTTTPVESTSSTSASSNNPSAPSSITEQAVQSSDTSSSNSAPTNSPSPTASSTSSDAPTSADTNQALGQAASLLNDSTANSIHSEELVLAASLNSNLSHWEAHSYWNPFGSSNGNEPGKRFGR